MYIFLNEYLKNKFGTKVYKLALSAVTTCPNRDGTVGKGGCIFCGQTTPPASLAPVFPAAEEVSADDASAAEDEASEEELSPKSRYWVEIYPSYVVPL